MPLADQLTDWQLVKWRCVVVVSVLSAAERTQDLLSQYGLESNIVTAPRPCWHWSQPGRLEIRVASLSVGFSIPSQKIAAVTEEEIFGKRERRRTASGWKEGAALDGIAQLQLGDPVVLPALDAALAAVRMRNQKGLSWLASAPPEARQALAHCA